MPPVPAQRRALSHEEPALSDEDVGFLFQVITRAERYPDADRLPYRVLFKAYDEAVAEHGPQADPGLALMRFLFKMGSKDARGDTLFERFENLLQQRGIVIELGNEENDTDAYTDNVSVSDAHPRTRPEATPMENTTQTIDLPRPRRASFNSMYDVGDDPTTRSFINRPSSRSSLSRLQTGKPEFEIPTVAGSRGAESTDRTQLIAQFMDVGRRLISKMDSSQSARKRSEEFSSAVKQDRSKRMTGASRAKASKPLNVSSGSSDGDPEEEEEEEGEEGDDLPLGSQDVEPFAKPDLPPEMLYRPSLSDLLRDASTFNMYRQRAINRRFLTQWMKKGAQARQAHQNMEMVAANRDRATLLRQAFGTWNTIIRNKRQVARTERFFKHLEERAARARDLYLLTKAFTHWAAVASDELERTTAARRHLLGVKYFNAWREITAVNVLKAQRFALHRPLQALKKKVDHVKSLEAQAVLHHDSKLKHGFYWQWFWSLCDRRAPRWHDYCVKRRALLSWLRNFRTNRERLHEIDMNNKHSMLRSALQALSTRSKAIVSAEQNAISMQRHRVLQSSFDEWKVQARLAPAASRVADTADIHILHSAYSQWVKRIDMLNQAREMGRRRIMRNSWVAWNDTLRCQALNARIEERLKIETMYKWILAERFRLMQRIREQRIKREVFSTFVTNVRETYTQLLYHADSYEDRRNDDLLRSKLDSWRNRLALQHQREDVAFEFYAPRLVQESLVAWRSKLQHMAKLEEWSRDASFYFAATRTLKRWHAATLDSAKRRRQDAYARVRRLIKVNLASKTFSTWRSRTHDVVEMEHQALQLDRGKSLDIASELLDQWHEKTAKQLHECEDADISYFKKIAYSQLIRWAEGVVESRQLEEQAISVYRIHLLGQANASLRKLSFRIFQIHSNAETADAMKERNLRKHSRGMFRLWVDKARMSLEARDSPGPLMSPTRNLSRAAATSGTEQSIFDPWHVETPFKLNDFVPELQSTSATPLATPNFMTSPSRRAARARALARASTTPATPLQTPFASRLLREGVSIPTTSSRPNRSGRRTPLTTSVRFADQDPESPTSGGGSSNRRP